MHRHAMLFIEGESISGRDASWLDVELIESYKQHS